MDCIGYLGGGKKEKREEKEPHETMSLLQNTYLREFQFKYLSSDVSSFSFLLLTAPPKFLKPFLT